MTYVSNEEIDSAKSIDLYTYLSNYNPSILKKISRNCYCTVDHDSLKISSTTGLWHWFSRRIGGKTALDYLIKVEEMSFTDAVQIINDNIKGNPPIKKIEPNVERDFQLPIRNFNVQKVISYLLSRGIDKSIIDYFISTGSLYEEIENHNAVFIGKDKYGEPKYAYMRGTSQIQFHSEVEGSDKRFAFSLASNSDHIHIFESAIDMLSFLTLVKMQGLNWKDENYLSLGGVYKENDKSVVPVALNQFLSDHLQIKSIAIHFDNDEIGKSAAELIKHKYEKYYKVRNSIPPVGKDVNEYLINEIAKENFKSEKRPRNYDKINKSR